MHGRKEERIKHCGLRIKINKTAGVNCRIILKWIKRNSTGSCNLDLTG